MITVFETFVNNFDLSLDYRIPDEYTLIHGTCTLVCDTGTLTFNVM